MHDKFQAKQISLTHVPSKSQIANIFTEALVNPYYLLSCASWSLAIFMLQLEGPVKDMEDMEDMEQPLI